MTHGPSCSSCGAGRHDRCELRGCYCHCAGASVKANPTTFDSIEAFYAADERRRRSGEVDFGVWWTEHKDQRAPHWRVSWVMDTGDLYFETDGRWVRDGKPTVEWVARVEDRELIETLLDGWAERCGPGGLPWVRGRVVGMEPR